MIPSAKTKNKQTPTRVSHRVEAADELGRTGLTIIISLAALIGLWGLSCLASGLVKGGGILGLGAAWVSAVFGA